MQISLVIDAPTIETLISIDDESELNVENMVNIRANPYPPNLRRIAANTIDPAIGASTWAFGSHRCTENIGSFTRNPVISISHGIILYFSSIGNSNIDLLVINKELEDLKIKQNITNIGSEAVMVYSIKYILA